ncbi:MAG: hypothetical protein S4CHLAM81_12200 [Chlamydiales bacterium]|nr:hypothetical protein [Chlamydiales bacterium]MCH9635995.1 hypothetical protein [Chlamydiales bacterium]MCH9703760.1 hypothetical protein [Chlamydiota bacterium]
MSSLPSLKLPIDCTDSCSQINCTCCSSNVSSSNWEKRIVRYNPADDELQSEPSPSLLSKILCPILFCCSGTSSKERNIEAFEAINIELTHEYGVSIQEAALEAKLVLTPYQQGRRPMKMRQLQDLKAAASEISSHKSIASNHPTSMMMINQFGTDSPTAGMAVSYSCESCRHKSMHSDQDRACSYQHCCHVHHAGAELAERVHSLRHFVPGDELYLVKQPTASTTQHREHLYSYELVESITPCIGPVGQRSRRAYTDSEVHLSMQKAWQTHSHTSKAESISSNENIPSGKIQAIGRRKRRAQTDSACPPPLDPCYMGSKITPIKRHRVRAYTDSAKDAKIQDKYADLADLFTTKKDSRKRGHSDTSAGSANSLEGIDWSLVSPRDPLTPRNSVASKSSTSELDLTEFFSTKAAKPQSDSSGSDLIEFSSPELKPDTAGFCREPSGISAASNPFSDISV